MIDRDGKINQIVASAIQAQSLEDRRTRQREQAQRTERETAEHYRQLAAGSEKAFSTGFPTVCTIH